MTERKIDSNKNQTRANGPYDMALVVTFGDKDKNGKAKTASATTSVKKGTDAKDAVSALSRASVQLLMDLVGERKKKRAEILAAYMERFVDAGLKLAGEDVMEKVCRALSDEGEAVKSHEGDGTKKRTFTLKLSDEDAKRLYIKAGKAGISVTELLENFIQDLTFSRRSNGSDEEDLANQWLDRCMFGMLSDRKFLMFVMEEENQDQMIELWTDLQEAKKRLAIGLSDFCGQEEMDAVKEDAGYWQESLEEYYQQFKKYGGGRGNGMEEDFKELVRWKQEFDAFMRGGFS